MEKLKRQIALMLATAMLAALSGCSQPSREMQTTAGAAQETSAEAMQETGAGAATAETTEETGSASTETSPEETTEAAAAETQAASQHWEWQHDTAENHGVDSAALETLHSELAQYPIHSFVLVRDEMIVDEYYEDGYDENSVFVLNSASKSITSALVGIAIEQGYIEGVDVPISTYFPQILESDSEWLKEVTIWNLLTHTSGISSSDTDVWAQWRGSENWVDFFLSRPVTSEPGTTFSYTTGGTHLLSAIIQQATGKTALEYGQEVLFGPLQMDSARCDTDPQGISDGGNGFYLNPYDMAKFGLLYLNGGLWEGEQIIPAQWVEDSTTIQFKRSTGSADYGYQWWVRTFGEQQYDAFFAQGHAGQYIFVVPPLNLVAVFTSDYEGSSSIYWQFMEEIVAACS